MQKPYACQLPGCTKRYTDPSSLRKHVKNHGLMRRKSSSGATNMTNSSFSSSSGGSKKTAKTRRHSESALSLRTQCSYAATANAAAGEEQQQQQRPQRSQSCSEAALLMQSAARREEAELTQMAAGMDMGMGMEMGLETGTGMGMGNRNACSADNVATNNNSIKFNELSNCIVIIEHTPNDVAATTATAATATSAATTIGSAATYAGFGYYSVAGAGQEGVECANIRSTAETDALSTCSSSNNSNCNNSNSNINNNSHNSNSNGSNNYKSNNIDCQENFHKLNDLEQLLCGTVEPGSGTTDVASCQLSEFVSFEYVRKYLTDAFDSPLPGGEGRVKSEVEAQLDQNFEHYDMQFI